MAKGATKEPVTSTQAWEEWGELAAYLQPPPQWSDLSRACHHHPYDLAPTANELRDHLDVARRFAAEVARQAASRRSREAWEDEDHTRPCCRASPRHLHSAGRNVTATKKHMCLPM